MIEVPLHITGFFSPRPASNPLNSGSIGAGVLIKPGIKCRWKLLKKGRKNKIFYNGKEVKITPIEELFNLINPEQRFLIELFSPVGLGFGYGASAASTLVVSLSICSFLKKPALEAAQLAHIAEVKSLTGLADVSAIFSGKGLVVRTKAGGPGIGKIKSYPLPSSIRILTVDLKKKETKKMLKSMSPQIKKLGLKLLKDFLNQVSLEKFFSCSQLFSQKMNFAKKDFFDNLKSLKKASFGISVKKGVLFTAVSKDSLPKARAILKKLFGKTHTFRPVLLPLDKGLQSVV
ncbi:MAG: hypothetical protein J7J21_01920 [Methanomicrobia archaeon]|nr:hypothetical protein [Methanomicrobia archaeon]